MDKRRRLEHADNVCTGFTRTSLRSQTVKAILGPTGGVPLTFWEQVDKLAIQTLALLLPFINGVGPGYYKQWKSFSSLYQGIHEIIQHAAWLSVCIRWSPSIINISWISPGTRYTPDVEDASPERLILSKQQAKALDEHDIDSPPTRVARVKISALPEIKRFTPGVSNNSVILGQRVYIVAKPRVVYYYGLANEANSQARWTPLSSRVRRPLRVMAWLEFFAGNVTQASQNLVGSIVFLMLSYLLFSTLFPRLANIECPRKPPFPLQCHIRRFLEECVELILELPAVAGMAF